MFEATVSGSAHLFPKLPQELLHSQALYRGFFSRVNAEVERILRDLSGLMTIMSRFQLKSPTLGSRRHRSQKPVFNRFAPGELPEAAERNKCTAHKQQSAL